VNRYVYWATITDAHLEVQPAHVIAYDTWCCPKLS